MFIRISDFLVLGQQVEEPVQVVVVEQPAVPVPVFTLVAEDVLYRHPYSLEDISIPVQKH